MLTPLTYLLLFRKASFTVLFLVTIFLFQRSNGQCSSTISVPGSSFSNNTTIGSSSWSSLGNVVLSDNGRASNGILLGVLATQNTHYIVIKNFGFSIPSSAAICGIEVSVERRATGLLIGSSAKDNEIKLLKNNIITGTNMASTASWPSSDGNQAYGSVSETWGSSWSPGDINSTDFGVAISAKLSAGLASLFLTAEIDRVSIRVYFNIILPVQLLSFKAIQEDEKVRLEWATTAESNNHHFTVERSANGITGWKAIDSIDGAGSSIANRHYRLTDNAPLPVAFYSLKQTSMDGHDTYSNIVSIQLNKNKSGLRVYPNPVSYAGELTMILSGRVDHVVIKTTMGEEIIVKDFVTLANGIKVKLPKMKNGYYWVIIQSSERIYKQKILVLSN